MHKRYAGPVQSFDLLSTISPCHSRNDLFHSVTTLSPPSTATMPAYSLTSNTLGDNSSLRPGSNRPTLSDPSFSMERQSAQVDSNLEVPRCSFADNDSMTGGTSTHSAGSDALSGASLHVDNETPASRAKNEAALLKVHRQKASNYYGSLTVYERNRLDPERVRELSQLASGYCCEGGQYFQIFADEEDERSKPPVFHGNRLKNRFSQMVHKLDRHA